MANNPYVNRVETADGTTLMDISDTTATEGDVISGKTLYKANGQKSVGTLDINGKADKVANATSGNFAGLDENGNLTDSGSKASDFLTEHQDISGKLDKPATVVNDKFIKIDSNGNVVCGDAATQEQITTAVDGWLEDNVDPETGYVLDRTLSMSNAATPADITGSLKSALDDNIGAIPYPGGTATLGNDPGADTSKLYYVNLPGNTKFRSIMYYDSSTSSWKYGETLDRMIDFETKKDAQRIKDSADYIRDNIFSLKGLAFTTGYYIKNNNDVGGTVDTSEVASSSYWCMIVPCKKQQKFVITVHGGSNPRAYSFIDSNSKQVEVSPADTNYSGLVLYAPCDGYFICNNKSDYTSATVETDDYIIETEHYADSSVTPQKASFFDAESHNLIKTDELTNTLYYSPGSTKVVASVSGSANGITGLIPVEPGETYTYSGTGCRNSGGYFGENAKQIENQASISSITFFAPVTGSGYCFTVPNNSNIKYVMLNVVKNTTSGVLDTNIQLEKGEMATPVQPYQLIYTIKPEYIPDNGGQELGGIDILPIPSYSFEENKMANFIAHNVAKDKDIVIAGTGTSLTARSSEHCTTRDDATSRPPLMHSNNFASRIWDRIAWDGQQYRRFDYSGFFTETGTWAESADLSDWDDANYRYGITRYASGDASVQFSVPVGAWQFNFIYRSDSQGTQSATVAISQGNGKMQVWNGSEWVEANGYTFSMRETPVTLSDIQVCNPLSADNSKVSQNSYQVGGNTTYQKRLKMRCKGGSVDSRDSAKTVTIASTSGRLMYWGVEWSPREFMITYINAARGSHNMTYSSSLSLSHFQDNEIWGFNPDLIFTENPIHNSGAAGDDMDDYYTTYWGYVTDDFFFNTDNPISFISRATANGITGLEWIVFNSGIAWNFGGINEDGTLKLYEDKSGKVISALDAQTMCYQWIADNKENVIAINACKYWCDAGRKLFGDLKSATVGSGKSGSTFTNEGSHWNDTGSAVMDRCIGGVFDFYN